MYFVISNSSDGIYIEAIKKQTVLDRLHENYYGGAPILTEMPEEPDPSHWPNGIIILSGSVVIPKTITTVTKYEI